MQQTPVEKLDRLTWLLSRSIQLSEELFREDGPAMRTMAEHQELISADIEFERAMLVGAVGPFVEWKR